MILDQWRKKSQLYRSNVLMVPLGDDFRYDRANEWDNQYLNYEMLIDYINSNVEYNAEVSIRNIVCFANAKCDPELRYFKIQIDLYNY